MSYAFYSSYKCKTYNNFLLKVILCIKLFILINNILPDFRYLPKSFSEVFPIRNLLSFRNSLNREALSKKSEGSETGGRKVL